MTWLWNKVQTIEGGILAFLSFVGTCMALWKWALPGMRKGWRAGMTVANLCDTLEAIRKEMKDGFQRLEEGQLHNIGVRHAMADTYDDAVIFTADDRGNLKWFSKTWIRWTGLEGNASRGRGWEMAILEEERAQVMAGWLQSIDHEHPYEGRFTLLNKFTHERTHVLVTASPIRLHSNGKIIDWFGAMKKDGTPSPHP